MTNHGQRENGRKPPVSILELLGQACVEHDGPVEIRARLDGDPDSDLVWEPVPPGEGFNWIETDRSIPTLPPGARKLPKPTMPELIEAGAREHLGMAGLAGVLGVSVSTLQRWRRGGRPSERTLRLMRSLPPDYYGNELTTYSAMNFADAAALALASFDRYDCDGEILIAKNVGGEMVVIGRPWMEGR